MNKNTFWAYFIAFTCTLYLIEGKAEDMDEVNVITDEPDQYVQVNANTNIKADIQRVKMLLPSARQGEVSKQLELAKLLIEFSVPEYDTAALHWLKAAAQSEDPESNYWLAHFYYEGIGSEVDYDKAFLLFLDLAKENYALHSARAKFKVAQMYYHGQGTEKNIIKAQAWTVEAARHDIREAHSLIDLFLKNENITLSDELLEFAIEKGDPQALYVKGLHRLYGTQGFEQDVEEGMELLELAAHKQVVPAQQALAKVYEKGLFGLENERKAFHWYLQASKNGDKEAAWHVAQMYYFGTGAEKDYIQSYAWAQIAFLKGKQEATLLRDEISFHLDSEEMSQAHYWSEKYAQFNSFP